MRKYVMSHIPKKSVLAHSQCAHRAMHVTPKNIWCDKYGCSILYLWLSHVTRAKHMSDVTLMLALCDASCHTCECGMACIEVRYATHMDLLCHVHTRTYRCICSVTHTRARTSLLSPGKICVSHVTCVHLSCHSHNFVMLYSYCDCTMSPVTNMIVSCPIYTWDVSEIWMRCVWRGWLLRQIADM